MLNIKTYLEDIINALIDKNEQHHHFNHTLVLLRKFTSSKKQTTLWDHDKRTPLLTLRGKRPFAPYSGFTPGTPVFTHYTSARQRYSPMEWWQRRSDKSIERVTELDIKNKVALSAQVFSCWAWYAHRSQGVENENIISQDCWDGLIMWPKWWQGV